MSEFSKWLSHYSIKRFVSAEARTAARKAWDYQQKRIDIMSGMNSWTEEDIRRMAREECAQVYIDFHLSRAHEVNNRIRGKYGLPKLPDADEDQPESQATQEAEGVDIDDVQEQVNKMLSEE